MLIYIIVLCSLQLLVGASAGEDSKDQTSSTLGMYTTSNIYTVTKNLYTPMY